MCRGSRRLLLAVIAGLALGIVSRTLRASEPNLILPKNWFADEVTEMQKPGELRTPVGERWRFNAAPLVNPVVWRQFVFISYAKLDPSVDVNELMKRQKAGDSTPPKMQHVTQCRDIETGNVLWSNTEISGGLIALPGYLLVLCSGEKPLTMERILLETKQGHIVKRFPYVMDPNADREDVRKLRESPLEFAEARALDIRQRLLRQVFSGESPVPLDIAQWTPDDARLVMDALTCSYVMRQGAAHQWCLFPNADRVVLLTTDFHLMYRDSSGGGAYWRAFFPGANRWELLWQPPYIVAFSTATSVTAYRIEDGSPAWMYEFQADYSSGGTANRFASLADGILLLTEPLHGMSENDFLSLSQPEQESLRPKKSPHLWLTKLDSNGRRLFQQELTQKPPHYGFTLSKGFLLLSTDDALVCYGPSSASPVTAPSDVLTPISEEQRRQEINRLHAEYGNQRSSFERRQICSKLGAMKDRSMLEIVLADLGKAASNENAKADYAAMLGSLNDRRAIDKLIPLLRDESSSVRQNASVSVQRLTGLGPTMLFSPELEEWWNRHKALYRE
jgi:hypothetical protein